MPQSLAVNYLHVIFSTKNREPFLADMDKRQSLHACMAEISHRLQCPAILIGGVADHAHILMRMHPTLALSAWVQEFKRVSSIEAKSSIGLPTTFAWQSGYAAFSVSVSNLDAAREYIAEQEAHHRKVTFQDELRAFLQKHGESWDERFVWG